jgi:predicted DCC family thiol-disulfide oxidoreductase YuxK
MTKMRIGTVLYDGACGFCSWWVPKWKNLLQKHGFEIATLQSDWVQNRIHMPEEELLKELRLLLENGQLINGADAYLYVMKKIPWTWPFGIFFSLPGFKKLFWWGYRTFSSNRYLVSNVCRMVIKEKKVNHCDHCGNSA